MKKLSTIIEESDTMCVHAKSIGAGHFKVVKTGSAVKVVKVGDEVKSSDLDDLAEAGHKIKEVR